MTTAKITDLRACIRAMKKDVRITAQGASDELENILYLIDCVKEVLEIDHEELDSYSLQPLINALAKVVEEEE